MWWYVLPTDPRATLQTIKRAGKVDKAWARSLEGLFGTEAVRVAVEGAAAEESGRETTGVGGKRCMREVENRTGKGISEWPSG